MPEPRWIGNPAGPQANAGPCAMGICYATPQPDGSWKCVCCQRVNPNCGGCGLGRLDEPESERREFDSCRRCRVKKKP